MKVLSIPVVNLKEVPLGELPSPNRYNTKGHKLFYTNTYYPIYGYSLIDLAVAGLTARSFNILPKSLNSLWVNYTNEIQLTMNHLILIIEIKNFVYEKSLLEWDLLKEDWSIRKPLVRLAPYTFGG
mgnify:CR=1 FL=1